MRQHSELGKEKYYTGIIQRLDQPNKALVKGYWIVTEAKEQSGNGKWIDYDVDGYFETKRPVTSTWIAKNTHSGPDFVFSVSEEIKIVPEGYSFQEREVRTKKEK
jgi:hypothetical protein